MPAPALGAIVLVRAPNHAAKRGLSHTDMLRPAVVTLTGHGWINCVAFNCQPGDDTFKCNSIPHLYDLDDCQSVRDYFVNNTDELEEDE